MAYVKTQWANGDVISAEKLNNIENGVSIIDNHFAIFEIPVIYTELQNSFYPFIGTVDIDEFTMHVNFTPNDIIEAAQQGKRIEFRFNVDFSELVEHHLIHDYTGNVTSISFIVPMYTFIANNLGDTIEYDIPLDLSNGWGYCDGSFQCIYPLEIFNQDLVSVDFISNNLEDQFKFYMDDGITGFNVFSQNQDEVLN